MVKVDEDAKSNKCGNNCIQKIVSFIGYKSLTTLLDKLEIQLWNLIKTVMWLKTSMRYECYASFLNRIKIRF